ncbi:MAG TPA: CRISPR-associated helicase Cas3' [Solidesulfovibrio sp.]|nr:CRISPR-associated helicase Cas3' [Solidesulfovibrio sp.]
MCNSRNTHVAHVCGQQDAPSFRIQTLESHLREVAALAESFAAKAGLPLAGRLIGLLHDFGKYSDAFQRYILSAAGCIKPDDPNYIDPIANKGKINHAFAGGQHAWRRLHGNMHKCVTAQMLALCMISHHSGLKDCVGQGGMNLFSGDYMVRSEEKTHHDQCASACDPSLTAEIDSLLVSADLLREVAGVVISLHKRFTGKLPAGSGRPDVDNENSRDFQQGLLVRFLLSCLLDADRTDSAEFEDPRLKRLREEAPRRPWDVLVPRLEAALAAKEPRHSIDYLRRDIADHCARRALDDQGIFTLTVPTGGGKTLASLRFALLHAQKHQLDRVIYVIPYTSIIDQNASVARQVLEQDEVPGSMVLEHHSNFLPDADTDDEGAVKRWEKLAENWDAPVVFTTMVQFLESLAGSGTRHARRMHNLARSVIVFDEVQTVPVRCLRMFCNAVEFLVEQCGASVMLCTATQPRLGGLPRPRLGSLSLGPEREIMPDVSGLFRELRRTDFIDHCSKRLSAEAVADLARAELGESGSCLVVCNTKKMAETLYALCPNREGLRRYYLSTNLCPAHRMARLEAMRADLDAGRPVLCVSTQLIECGVDISFRSVIRLAAGLDSILQAAGRCNRHGEGERGRVHVVLVDGDVEKLECLRDIKAGRDVFLDAVRLKFAKTLENSDYDLTQPLLTEAYFDHYYTRRADVMSYACTEHGSSLLDMLGSNKDIVKPSLAPMLGQSFATAAKHFKAIDSAATSILVPYDEGRQLIADLYSTDILWRKKELLRKAQRYCVNIFPNMERVLHAAEALDPVQDSGMFALKENFYCDAMGVVTQPTSRLGFIDM